MDRASLCGAVAVGLADWGAGERAALERTIWNELRDFSDADLGEFGARLTETGSRWGFHPYDPIARRLSRLAHSLVLQAPSVLTSPESLAGAHTRPGFLVANHQS